MAQDSSQEKTEEATPRRLREARKKGQVAKSKDLNTIVILVVAFGMIAALKGYIGDKLKMIMHTSFQIAYRKDIADEELFYFLVRDFEQYLWIILPFLAVFVMVAFFIGFFQIGPIFSADPLKPKTDRLNLFQNIKNMFKVTTFVELLKNIAKICLMFGLAYMVVSDNLRMIVLTVSGNIRTSAGLAGSLLAQFLIKVFICFVIIALIDLAVQRWQFKKNLRMTKDEVKREYKQDEGDPLIKSMRRQFHQEIAMSDVKQAVKSADVVVTNPTHLAVALKYDDAEMVAPQIVAKGQRLFAEAIRDMADEYEVPIVRNVPLAWTLIELDVGDEIPEEIYAAVAELLIVVYQMRDEKEAANPPTYA
jgi:flagellar biosynthetic protein FlhB